MFNRAYAKLAGLYLLIIMAISLLFSVSIYFVSARELERGAGLQGQLVENALGPRRPFEDSRLRALRQETLSEAKARVVGRLILVNAAIVIIAGGLSYYLAYRTLHPIEEAHESLERFTADASHELRTPITAMQTEIEVLLQDPKLSLKDAKKQLESNLEELAKLNHLSDGLLQLARLDTTSIAFSTVPIQEVLMQAVNRVELLAKGSQTKIRLPKTLDFNVSGDMSMLVEGFVTLFENAVKHSPPKSVVTVAAHKTRHNLNISVVDNGPGIKAAELPYIFERFYQADSSRNKNSGTGYGLGLAIAHNIFKAHHGTIQAKSSLGKGTTMVVTLPLAK